MPLSHFPVACDSANLDFLACAGTAAIARPDRRNFDCTSTHCDNSEPTSTDKHDRTSSNNRREEENNNIVRCKMAVAAPIKLRVFRDISSHCWCNRSEELIAQLSLRSPTLPIPTCAQSRSSPGRQEIAATHSPTGNRQQAMDAALRCTTGANRMSRAISTTFCGCSTQTLMASRRSSTP